MSIRHNFGCKIFHNKHITHRKKGRNSILPYVLVSPLLILLIATIFIPALSVVYQSLFNTTYVGTKGKFIFLNNYISIISDITYWEAWLKGFFWLFGCTIVQTLLGFSTALLLNNKHRFTKVLRVGVIIPWIIPATVVAIMWQWILNSSYGILNSALLNLGLISSPTNFLGGSTALISVILINTWHWFPFSAIILLAGLGTIPNELYESALVDGANRIQRFFRITMPMLSSVTFTLGVVGTLWSFNIFDLIWILTNGGPLNSSTTVPVYIYREAFQNFRIGRTSAASVITAVLLLILATILIKLTKPKDD